MRTAFLFGLLAGFAGLLAAVHYYPWVDHPRLASLTRVVPNGGRAEDFLIRLPADRIVGAGSLPTRVRSQPFPAGLTGVPAFGETPWLAEHFKVRDAQGRVIGVASRHWASAGDDAAAAWALVIPSRGALLLASTGETAALFEQRLQQAGYDGGAWSGELTVDVVEQGGGRVVGGSQEFAGLDGSYREAWNITGAGDNGDLRGTIALTTVTGRDR